MRFLRIAFGSMNSVLPPTGTEQLLRLLSPFVPDQYLQDHWPQATTGGRRHAFSAAQLWRVHLLALLTPVHSLNLLVRLLSEQRAWRQFAHLPHRQRLPGVRMLHEFRERVGVSGARQINELLLDSLLESVDPVAPAVGLIDATDLKAACSGSKKKHHRVFSSSRSQGNTQLQDRTEHLVYRLQKTQLATLAFAVSTRRTAGATGQLGGSGQCFRRAVFGVQPAEMRAPVVLVAKVCDRRYGLPARQYQAPMPRALACCGSDASALRHEAGRTFSERASSCLSSRSALELAGLRSAGAGALVWRRAVRRSLRQLLGSQRLPSSVCLSRIGS